LHCRCAGVDKPERNIDQAHQAAAQSASDYETNRQFCREMMTTSKLSRLKHSPGWAPYFAVAFLIGCSALHALAAEYAVLPGSASPNAQLALAWGLAGANTVNWEALKRGEGGTFPREEELGEKVENYVVNVETGKILAKVPDTHLWALPNGQFPNHVSLKVGWTETNDAAVAIFAGKWGYESVKAVLIGSAAEVKVEEIGRELESVVRKELGRKLGKKYESRKDHLTVSFDHLERTRDGAAFLVQATAQVVKSPNPADTLPEVRLRLSPVRKGEGKLKVAVAEGGR
jgi:hypothetical protein